MSLARWTLPMKGGKLITNVRGPGEWFDNTDFKVFVGGSGIGPGFESEGEAMIGAREYTLAGLSRRIVDLNKRMREYEELHAKVSEDFDQFKDEDPNAPLR